MGPPSFLLVRTSWSASSAEGKTKRRIGASSVVFVRKRSRFGGVSKEESVSELSAGDPEEDAEVEARSLGGVAPVFGKPWRTAHGLGLRAACGCDMAAMEADQRSDTKRPARFEQNM